MPVVLKPVSVPSIGSMLLKLDVAAWVQSDADRVSVPSIGSMLLKLAILAIIGVILVGFSTLYRVDAIEAAQCPLAAAGQRGFSTLYRVDAIEACRR